MPRKRCGIRATTSSTSSVTSCGRDEPAKGLGLGESTGIEIFELKGVRANTETKKAHYTGADALWYPADAIQGAIGQGLNKFTPMQLAV